MIDGRKGIKNLIIDFNVLGATENRLLEIGAPLSGVTVLDTSGLGRLTWQIFLSDAATFSIETSISENFATFDTLYSQAVLAATMATPYNLAAPFSYTGDVVIPANYARFRVDNSAGGLMTISRIFIKAL